MPMEMSPVIFLQICEIVGLKTAGFKSLGLHGLLIYNVLREVTLNLGNCWS